MRIYRPESTRAIPPGAKVNQEKKTVTYRGRGGEIVKAILTDSGKMRVVQSVWHISFRDHLDRERDTAAFEDEGDSRILAKHIENLVIWQGKPLPPDLQAYCDQLNPRIAEALQSCALLERKQTPLARPLSELVAEYGEALTARGRNDRHVNRTIAMAREVVATRGFSTWDDIDRDKVDAFLRDLREGPRHVSYRRSNAYLTALKSFCNWVANDRGWARESPLRTLKSLDVKQDRRHPRRALSIDEFKRLLHAAQNGPARFGLPGQTRATLYAFVFETGLRAEEVRRLRTADFDLSNHRVLIRGVKATKNKVDRWQNLSAGLCGDLAGLLTNKLPSAPVFSLPQTAAYVLKEDLADAGIAYQAPDGSFFDFHALRGECASGLISMGTDVKTSQGILRHATAAQTMDVYARVLNQNSAGQAVAGLRDLYADEAKQANEQVAARTGTDDAPELYGEVYAKDKHQPTTSVNMRQATPQDDISTAAVAQNQGSLQTACPSWRAHTDSRRIPMAPARRARPTGPTPRPNWLCSGSE